MTELSGGQERWDAARTTTALMVGFLLESCGMELSIGMTTYEGVADVLHRPPPMGVVKNIDGVDIWMVRCMSPSVGRRIF